MTGCTHFHWTCFYEDRNHHIIACCMRCRQRSPWQWSRDAAEVALEVFPIEEASPEGEAEIFTAPPSLRHRQ